MAEPLLPLFFHATEYCAEHGLNIETELGRGTQGIVLATSRPSALKVHHTPKAYAREVDVYRRLTAHRVADVRGLIVPTLLQHDDKRLILEMTLVSPPFLLDFGSAYLDTRNPHGADDTTLSEWEQQQSEQFGTDWSAVRMVILECERRYGVFLQDVHPGNIRVRR